MCKSLVSQRCFPPTNSELVVCATIESKLLFITAQYTLAALQSCPFFFTGVHSVFEQLNWIWQSQLCMFASSKLDGTNVLMITLIVSSLLLVRTYLLLDDIVFTNANQWMHVQLPNLQMDLLWSELMFGIAMIIAKSRHIDNLLKPSCPIIYRTVEWVWGSSYLFLHVTS